MAAARALDDPELAESPAVAAFHPAQVSKWIAAS
jgi:hypothetical protein